MATTITRGATSIVPIQVDGYKSERKSTNILHPIIGRANGSPDVTFGATALRTGTLTLIVGSLADALALEAIHTAGGVVTLSDSDLPLLGMRYVWVDGMTVELDDETRDFWRVEVDFQEVI